MSSETKSRKPARKMRTQRPPTAWDIDADEKRNDDGDNWAVLLLTKIFTSQRPVAELVIDYTNCDKAGPTFVRIPENSYSVNFPNSDSNGEPPEYKAIWGVGSANNITWPTTKCTVKINLPVKLIKPVFVYYRLTNFYQNHRRYVKSLDAKQLSGVARDASELKGGSCDPLATVLENGVLYPIYPCGLIANSIFNDTFSLFLNPLESTTNNNKSYILTDTGISWKSDMRKYGSPGYTNLSAIRPPPNWKKFPNGYSEDSPPMDLSKDEHFQVWMRTAGLPNFRKLYSKNEQDDLQSGTYTIDIDMNYNVTSYGGTKSIVISTVSFIGGRNPFLGIAYVVVGVLCVVLGLLFTARHLYKPRRLGDHTYLSWNQNAAASNAATAHPATSATATGASVRY
ncbi:hypothetical protein BGZ65_002871 [Modicella reniformis]|uniref:Cell cycle control protein n=1 Tax=Modicella reniformis TaxID=1440133 RepID=A0A9P6ILA9_9FUNG|nr:hypothetical protein BGZ65_002871 [Modicella reniformis]